MKRNGSKLLVLVLAFVLTVSLYPNDTYGKNSAVEDNPKVGDIQINLSQSEKQMDVEKIAVERIIARDSAAKTEEFITGELQMEDIEEDITSTIYYGTMSGYLSATDDYLLYPANLNAGDYLQAKLTLPNNAQIDYDLLLFNSSLSLIKSSDYVTYVNDAGTLEESIGYLATSNETVYVCPYSVAGGSSTEAFTLDYSITTNFTDSNEPNENAKEAVALTMGIEGAKLTGKINSPIDNDWYSFTVLDSPAYDKMRLIASSNSTVNGCKFELYRNLVTSNYYGMQYLGSGTGGEVELPAGTYYLRIVSTNTFNDFNASDISTYDLSVLPVSRVDVIKITEIKASHSIEVDYPEGKFVRVDGSKTQLVRIKGTAYYIDEIGARQPSVNAIIQGEVEDQQWKEIHRPDMAIVNSSAIVDSEGSYQMYFSLNSALGGLKYSAPVSTHHYDLMVVTVHPMDNERKQDVDRFYYLKYCDLYN